MANTPRGLCPTGIFTIFVRKRSVHYVIYRVRYILRVPLSPDQTLRHPISYMTFGIVIDNATSKRRSRLKPESERKRPKYVFKACASCKRRKVRCNGKAPCEFCERRSIECRYSNELESSKDHTRDLNNQEMTLKTKNVASSHLV